MTTAPAFRIPVTSSSLAALGYDVQTELLEVEFHRGPVYRYARVPKALAEAFLQAESKGRFFNAFIRLSFAFEKVH